MVHPVDPFHSLDNLKNHYASITFCKNSAIYNLRNGAVIELSVVVSIKQQTTLSQLHSGHCKLILMQPIGTHGGEAMYFGCVCFRGMCVVNKEFELLEFVFDSVYVDLQYFSHFYCWVCLLVVCL